MGNNEAQLGVADGRAANGRFNARRSVVRRWLRELPVANPVETGRQLYEGLTDANRRQMRPSKRLAFLNELHEFTRSSIEGLRPHYQDRELPLRGTPRKVATLSTRLLQEMALGHELAVDDLRRGTASKGRLALVLVNALHYRGLALVENWLIHENPPPGNWQRLHALYQIALDRGLTRRPIRPPWAGSRVTPAACYKRAVLTACADPLRLDRGEILDVWWLLGHWACSAEISALGQDADQVFRVPRSEDRPPHASIDELNRRDDRFLVTTPLVRRGQRELHRANKRRPWRQPPAAQCPALARRLLIALAAVPARQNKRVRVTSQVQAMLGISQGHQALSHELGLPVIGSDTRERAFQGHDRSEPKGERDVWNIIHPEGLADVVEQRFGGGIGNDRSASSKSGDDDGVAFHRWQLVDISPGGYCLLTRPEQGYRAHPGELIVVRESAGSKRSWQLGVVRWLRGLNENGLQLGVQIIGFNPRPVMVRALLSNGNYSPPERAFILPVNGKQGTASTIITPWPHYQSGQTVSLRYGKKHCRISLGRCYEASNHFCQCAFQYADPVGTDDSLATWLSGEAPLAAS